MPIFNLTNGNDTFPSGAINSGDDTINGLDGDDVINAGLGADTVDGGEGNDRIHGNDGADSLDGGNGDDTLYGQAGDDTLNGDDGNDTLDGGAGADSFDGGNGFDTVSFRAAAGGIVVDVDGSTDTGVAVGDDFVSIERFWMGTGGDTFIGSATDNTEVWGIEGDDILTTGAGADRLNGGIGNDTMTGGAGADVFVLSAGNSGADTITDFADGQDLIQIYGGTSTQFSDLTIADDGSGNALITLADGSTITLSGFDFNNLDSSDFIFGP